MIGRIRDIATVATALLGLAVVATLVRKRDVYAWTDKSELDLAETVQAQAKFLGDVLTKVTE